MYMSFTFGHLTICSLHCKLKVVSCLMILKYGSSLLHTLCVYVLLNHSLLHLMPFYFYFLNIFSGHISLMVMLGNLAALLCTSGGIVLLVS